MTSRQRMLAALQGRQPDRLPVTTHHVMPSFLDKCLGGITAREFFDAYGLRRDRVDRPPPPLPRRAASTPTRSRVSPAFLESRRVATDNWRVFAEPIPDPARKLTRYRFATPPRRSLHGARRRRLHCLGHRAAD